MVAEFAGHGERAHAKLAHVPERHGAERERRQTCTAELFSLPMRSYEYADAARAFAIHRNVARGGARCDFDAAKLRHGLDPPIP